jgi:hypothetical protein
MAVVVGVQAGQVVMVEVYDLAQVQAVQVQVVQEEQE